MATDEGPGVLIDESPGVPVDEGPGVPVGLPSDKDGMPAHLGPIPLGFDVPKQLEPIFNFGNSIMANTANLIGAPVEIVDEAFRVAGYELLENPGDAQAALRKGFNKVGIETEYADTLSAKLGRATFEGLVSLVAIGAAAPKLLMTAAQKSVPTMRGILDQIGRWTIQAPWITASTELGSQTGAVLGGEYLPDITYGEHTLMSGEAQGAILGGGVSGVAPNVVRMFGKSIPAVTGATIGGGAGLTMGPGVGLGGAVMGKAVAQRVAGSGWRFLRSKLQKPPSDTMLPEARPMTAASRVDQYVQDQMADATAKIDNVLAQLPKENAESYASDLRDALHKAQGVARQMERDAYSDEFLSQTTDDVQELIVAALNLSKMDRGSAARPTKDINRILRQFGEKTDLGWTSKPEITGHDLQQLRGDLSFEWRKARSGEAPNKSLARNLQKLIDAVDAELRLLPGGEEAVNNAHAISKELNDLFFRGPMLQVFRKRATGEPFADPVETTGSLLRRSRGLRQVEDIAARYDQPELIPLTRLAVRANFRRAAEAALDKPSGPATRGRPGSAAQRWMEKNKSAIDSFADEAIQLQQYTDQLLAGQNEIIGINKGAYLRFAGKDPDKAIGNIFTSGNPAKAAAEIREVVQSDPQALAGFEHDFLVQLFQNHRYSGKKLYDALTEGHPERRTFGGATARLVQAALGDDKAKRLMDIAERVAKIETGETKITGVGGPVMHYLYQLAARVAGVGVGKRVIDQPTIQEAGAVAQFSTSFVKRLAGKVDYSEVFSLVVNDPKWEQIIMNEVPLTAPSTKDLNKQMRMLLTAIEATRQAGETSIEEIE